MNLSIRDIRKFLETTLPEVSVHDSTPDLFFFGSDDLKFPFATIVTHDDPLDNASELDRPGVFRLNFATDKQTFQALFPNFQSREALENSDIDYAESDVLFPHPVYGRMRWVSVVNPHSTWNKCQNLLMKAREIRELRPNSW